MALHPHQSGNLALSLQDQQMNLQMLIKQQLQAMAHVSAEVRVLAENLGQLGQLSGMVKAAMIGMVGAPRALSYGLRYALLSGTGHTSATGGAAGGTPGEASPGGSGGRSGTFPTQAELIAQIRERSQVKTEEELRHIAVIGAVYEQQEKKRKAQKLADLKEQEQYWTAIEKRNAQKRLDADKRRVDLNRQYEERSAKQHALRMERMAEMEVARSQLQLGAHKDLIALHEAVAELRKKLSSGEETSAVPNVLMGEVAAAKAAVAKSATPASGTETATERAAREVRERASTAATATAQVVHPMAATMSSVAARAIHPMAAAMSTHWMTRAMGGVASTGLPSGGGDTRMPIEQLGSAQPPLLRMRVHQRMLDEAARKTPPPLLKPSEGGIEQKAQPLFRFQKPAHPGPAYTPPNFKGPLDPLMAGIVAGFKKLPEHFDKLGKAIEGASRGFLVLTTAAQSLIQQASPDLWATLSGSIELLVGQLGQALIPQILKLSEWLQNAAEGVRGWDEGTKDLLGQIMAWSAAILGGATVLNILATTVKSLWPLFKTLGRWLGKLSIWVGGLMMTHPVAATVAAGATALAFSDKIPGTAAWFEKNWDKLKGVPSAEEAEKERWKFMRSDKEVMETPEVKQTFDRFKGNPKAAADYFFKRQNEASNNATKIMRRAREAGYGFTPENPNKLFQSAEEKQMVHEYNASMSALKIFNRAREIATSMRLGKPVGRDLEEQKQHEANLAHKLTPEGKSAKLNLLLAMRSFRANPVYSSIEEQYKKTQVTALGKDPIEQAIDKLRMESMEKVIQLLDKHDKNDQAIFSLWESMRPFGRQ